MHVGASFIFQHPDGNEGDPAGDKAVYKTEYELADRVEGLGFDSLWSVEHHFNGYAMCPDPLQFLSYFAGRTKHVKLGTMVTVAPWRDPIRIAETCSVLDEISDGRLILGIGRGVAKTEFDGFRVDMNTSRQLLVETTEAALMGLETGQIEYDGEVIKQGRVLIRPKPTYSYKDRVYISAASPETYKIMARLGVGLLFIPGTRVWTDVAADLEGYRALFREVHGREAPPPIFAGWVFVDEDAERARELGRRYISGYIKSALAHYDTKGAHLKNVKGYESYVAREEAAAARGVTEVMVENSFVESHVYGTPDQCFERIAEVRKMLGACAFLAVFNYAGMPREEALRNQALFAAKVLPRLKAHAPHLDIGRGEPSMAA